MSLPCFMTRCLHCNSLCEQRFFLPSVPSVCLVTLCVNNESSLLDYPLFAFLHLV
ncbi:hypothetical protein KSS87_023099 [Heliosperma pusillum]|nr:hypothetical protein KSS87_023099 [Heliosperma pusillum]